MIGADAVQPGANTNRSMLQAKLSCAHSATKPQWWRAPAHLGGPRHRLAHGMRGLERLRQVAPVDKRHKRYVSGSTMA